MEKTQGQEKYLKVLKLLNGCRAKLLATYNLFVANLETVKQTKAELGEMYEQLLDMQSELVQATSNKPAKVRMTKICKDAENLKAEHDAKVASTDTIMDEANTCRKAYKKEIIMCCDTYKTLKERGVEGSLDKGYNQQVKLVKRILEKIDVVKANYKGVKDEIKIQAQMFVELFNKINNAELVLA
jgi:uncharacterized protein YycO